MLAAIRTFANLCGANACLFCGMQKVCAQGCCDECESLLLRWYPRCLKHLADFSGQEDQRASDYWFAPLRWSLVTQTLIHRYKSSSEWQLASPMSVWLAAHLTHCYRNQQLHWPDLIVAMPTTSSSWQQRGFHHTGQLAQSVADILGLCCQPGVLRLVRRLPKQKQLNRTLRWQFSRGSQHCTINVSGLRVAVVDDMVSSGATLTAAAKALKKQGAREVHSWALIYNPGD